MCTDVEIAPGRCGGSCRTTKSFQRSEWAALPGHHLSDGHPPLEDEVCVVYCKSSAAQIRIARYPRQGLVVG